MSKQPYFYSHLILPQLATHLVGGNVLDVGCGGGWLTRELKQRHPALKIEGMDKHYKFIQSANYHAYQQQLDISYRIENLETLSAETYKENYELITCHNVFAHIRQPQKEMLKLLSWLKKGGVLSVIIENPASHWVASAVGNVPLSFEAVKMGYEQNELPEAFANSRAHLKTRRVLTGDPRVLYSATDVEKWLSSLSNVSIEMRGLSVFMDYISNPNIHSSEQISLEQKLSVHPLWNPYAYFHHFLIIKKE